ARRACHFDIEIYGNLRSGGELLLRFEKNLRFWIVETCGTAHRTQPLRTLGASLPTPPGCDRGSRNFPDLSQIPRETARRLEIQNSKSKIVIPLHFPRGFVIIEWSPRVQNGVIAALFWAVN